MSSSNADLLFATLDKVIAVEPLGLWDQTRWHGQARRSECGCDHDGCPHRERLRKWKEAAALDANLCKTAGCFAGWALVVHHGGVAMREHGGDLEVVRADKSVVPIASVQEEAMDALGLDYVQAEALFQASNTLAQLKDLVSEYAGEQSRG